MPTKFLITIDPGTTVTYVAELKGPNVPQVYLWDQDAYRKKTSGLTLYKGIIIGIAGLLALFLTIIFVVKGAIIFPAAAALSWAVLSPMPASISASCNGSSPSPRAPSGSTAPPPRRCSGRRSSSSCSPT